MSRVVWSNILGLAGAVSGAVLGVLAARWISTQGFYAPIVPGGFVGLGCGFLARHRSVRRGLACAGIALAAGIVSEYVIFTFAWNPSDRFIDFLGNIHKLKPLTWLLLSLGAAIAYWVGRDSILGPGFFPRQQGHPPGA